MKNKKLIILILIMFLIGIVMAATWGSISGGDDAEVILNSPADDSTFFNNLVTFNATANVTGGAYLMNISLWGNFSGDWEISNTTVLDTAWDLSTASYNTNSPALTSQDPSPQEASFSSNGTKMYIVGNTNDAVFQYSLSTAWDLSTASYDSVSLSVSSQDGNMYGMFFKNDGTKMYLSGASNDRIYQYSLSTAWDLSTASYDSVSLSVSSQDGTPTGIYFRDNGIKMYMSGLSNDRIYQYSLSTAWDLSTASYDSVFFSVSSQDTDPHGLYFKNDGLGMYMVGDQNNRIYQYSLSTAWDLSTASYDSVFFSVSSQDTAPYGLYFKDDGLDMYMTGTNNKRVYQYDLGEIITNSTQTWNLTLNNSIIWNVQACDSDGDCGFAPSNYSLFVDSTAPDITNIYPIGIINYNKIGDIIDLNWTVTDNGILDTCWYEYNNTNTTVNCGDNHTTFTITNQKNLTFYANDSLNNVASNITTWDYKIFENSRNFTNESYETQSETFSINLTANSSLTSVKLLYNGTEYSTTNSNGVYSTTLDIPEGVSNNSVRWKFTYSGDTIYSDYSYQNISLVNFSLCAGSLTDDFLNISFKDEDDLSSINASITTSTFIYYLGEGTVNKTYTFSNVSNNYFYRFCATPTTETLKVKPYVQYKQGTDYPQRIWDAIVQSYTSTVTNKILYLLNTINGIYVTFQVINSAEQGISGVSVTGTREIEGETITIASGETDSAGGITFWLNPDFVHTFNFSKSGYESLIFTTAPTQSSYTITLTTGEVSDTDCSRGVAYAVSPGQDYLDRNTNYNFSLTTSSSYWNFDNYTASLYYGNDTLISSQTGTTEEGSTLDFLNINVTNQSTIYMEVTYSTNSTLCLNTTRVWYVQSTEGRDFSLFKLFSDINRAFDANLFGINGESGDDTFGRALLTFVILISIAGVTISRYGLQNETAIMGMLFGLILVLDVGFGLIPAVSIGNMVAIDYFISIITFITFVAFLIREEIR